MDNCEPLLAEYITLDNRYVIPLFSASMQLHRWLQKKSNRKE